MNLTPNTLRATANDLYAHKPEILAHADAWNAEQDDSSQMVATITHGLHSIEPHLESFRHDDTEIVHAINGMVTALKAWRDRNQR